MKLVVFLFACLAFASSSPEQEWANFKLKFGKGYRSLAHEAERKAIFMTSLEKIETHNAKFDEGLTTYKQGINYYSDWTWEEFKDVILMEEQSSQRSHPKKASLLAKEKPQTKFESSKDWTSIMGYVKNQGHCGSCWAFGAIGVMESAWYLAGNGKIVLSEQMLVDCGPGDGCNGGWVDYALDYLIEHGAETDASYPYTSGVLEEAGTCKYDSSLVAATISDYDRVYVDIEGTDALARSVNDNGPHAIYVYVNDNFRHYESGIFEDPSCPTYSYNHAVINVGYDTVAGYWLVRNSWGYSWGEGGHIKMAMGQNVCNSENYAWVPKV